MNALNRLWPAPLHLELQEETFPKPERFRFQADSIHVDGDLESSPDGCPIEFKTDAAVTNPEGYILDIAPGRIEIRASAAAGTFYGWQTLLQLIRYSAAGDLWQRVRIEDRPAFRKRCFMADMGRSVFPLPLLKQLVRILARLKMNQLHLHLYDDELCGIRFEGLPFGSENPCAITVAELGELVRFAADFHVEIVPELEGWGHVGSLVAHRPDLRGGKGLYNGSSFLIGEPVFEVMRNMISQIAEVMPPKARIHLGLDEALWFCAPGMPAGFTPEKLVGRYYRMLQEIGQEKSRELSMRIWGDHAGRPVPAEISSRVVIEPWCYWNALRSHMDFSIGRYASGASPWMAGAGQSMGQHRGAYHATRYWAKRAAALEIANLEGINLTFWGRNDLENHFITLFAGAGFIWNPNPQYDFAKEEEYENFERRFFPIQTVFQHKFREAWPDTLRKLRPTTVYHGHHYFDDKHGEPFTPFVPLAGTANQHNFLTE
jgi:hypothetical protein